MPLRQLRLGGRVWAVRGVRRERKNGGVGALKLFGGTYEQQIAITL